MLHGQTTNQNSPSPSSTRHEPPTSTRTTTSAELWRTFTAHARGFRGANFTVFENVKAKAAVRDRNQGQLWVQSNEMNSAVFDLKQLSVLPTDFYEALANQYPSAIGAVPVCQGAINGVIIAFDFAESRTAACSVALSRYGTVLHVGLYRDPVSRLFFGKGYALIDTAPEDRTILPLSHEIDLTNQRLIYASWRGMAPHCFYCHKPGHMKGNCPRLSQQRIKTCYSCGDPSHLIRERPKRNTATVGEKRTRYDNPLPTVPVSFSSLTLGSSSTQNSSSPTPILSAVSKSVHQSDIESSKMTVSVQKNIVRTRSKASTTITTAVIPEEDDDANDPDYTPSDDQSESDESEHDSDVMSIDSQERQDIEDDARLLQSSSTPGATPQSDGEAAHSSSTPLQETHADTFAFHSQFELCLQTYSSTWTRHCGLISFNRQLAIEPRWSSVDGRLLVAQVTDASGAYDPLLIYVLYAPAHHTDRPAFFHSLNSMLHFDDAPPQRTVLLGDFNHNIHLSMTHQLLQPWKEWLHSFCHDTFLSDSNQHCLPTFGTISTIDFILVTSDMQHLTTHPHLTYVKGCDHSALTICLTVGPVKVGPGIWRCNPLLMGNRKFRSELTAFCSSAE
ncbi:hypothetical protein G6F36_012388 [Rhizopus arrhizus]|nr:hypothetical protein G6F36_012388 [Rhizopus arrhizus]